MIYFSCQKCGTRLSADPAYIGKAVLCCKCKQKVLVPNPPVAVRVDPPSASGRQPTPPGKFSQRHVVAQPTDATLPLSVQGNKRRLSWLSSKKKAAVVVLPIVLVLIVGSAAGLTLALHHQQPHETNEEQLKSHEVNERQLVDTHDKADEVDGDSLLPTLENILKEHGAPTVNAFKRQKAQEQYQAALDSFRGRLIHLPLRVKSVSKESIGVENLTRDPDYNPKMWNANMRWRAGGPEPKPRMVLMVHIDLSGQDWGTVPYKMPMTTVSGNATPDFAAAKVVESWIASDRIDAHLLRELDKGQTLVVRGKIVSLVPYHTGAPFNHYTDYILSLKLEKIAVDHP